MPGVLGFRGDGLTTATDVDPQTVTAADVPGVIDVNANQFFPDGLQTGGVTEFEIEDPVVALQGSGTADAPYLIIHVDASGQPGIIVSYRLRDLDSSPDNAVSQVALQFRTAESGSWTNVPAGYVGDATIGPFISGLDTAVSVALPASAAGAATLQIRIITTNATGNDEWVGVDDIAVQGAAVIYHTLDVVVIGNGTVIRSPDEPAYTEGTVVELTASSATGWSFAGWSGDASGLLNPTSVTMDADKSVTATFVPSEPFPPHRWSHLYGEGTSATISACTGVAIDGAANVLFAGVLKGTADFGGGLMTGPGRFLVKFDELGTHQWSTVFANEVTFYGPNPIAADTDGNVFLPGTFSDTIDLGGGPLTSAGGEHLFLAKFDPAGAHAWSKAFECTALNRQSGCAVDASGNIVITGWFEESIDFGGGPLFSAGAQDIYLAKFGPDGTHLWSKSFPGVATDRPGTVDVDPAGNIFTCGTHSGPLDLGGGELTWSGTDVYIAKYDSSGNHLWSATYGTQSPLIGVAIGADADGNVFVGGGFSTPVDFGGGVLGNSGSTDVFLVKFDPSGAHVWSNRFGDGEFQICKSLAVDEDGSVTIFGEFTGTVSFGGELLTGVSGHMDLFLAKFGPAGTHRWSARFGDEGSQSIFGDQFAYDVVDRLGAVVIVGQSNRTIDFGGGVLGGIGEIGNAYVASFGEPVVTAVEPGAVGREGIQLSAWPNPTRNTVNVSYHLAEEGPVHLGVYAIDGRRVATLVDGHSPAREASFVWDGRDSRGQDVSAGIYFLRLVSGTSSAAERRVVMLR